MHDEHPHPLLAQVPLTVSPFLSLPTATPLPYTYKQLPSTLPQSVLSPNSTSNNPSSDQNQQPAYIVSSSGQTATPDAILSSCLALQQHLSQLESSARRTLTEWEEKRRAEDLAEKRRVAPGWLDGDVKLLVPENVANTNMEDVQSHGETQRGTSTGVPNLMERSDAGPGSREGEELDRAFGGLDIK